MTFKSKNIYVIYCDYITPPKPKICLCVCDKNPYFAFINTNPRTSLPGQILIQQAESAALKYDSYVDLSGLKIFASNALAKAADRGPVQESGLIRIRAALNAGIKTLSANEIALILKNLT